MVSSSETSPRYPIDADALQRLELLVKAFEWHRREEGDRSVAEYLEDLHRDHAERAGLPEPVDSYGDTFVAKEVTQARDLLDRLCGTTTCQAPGCTKDAPAHWGLCLHHDLEAATRRRVLNVCAKHGCPELTSGAFCLDHDHDHELDRGPG